MPVSHKPGGRSAPQFIAPPDPGQAITLDDLVERLRLLKVWAGNPSYERLMDQVNAAWRAEGRPAAELASKTTVVRCFESGRRRLNVDLVVELVRALHPDVGYAAQWRQVLGVVSSETEAAAQVRVLDTLPEDLAGFTGRAAELGRLRREFNGEHQNPEAVVIFALAGMAGVGKTRLALHAGHQLLRERPDMRVLFVNLRGFHADPLQPPADPAAVLDGFLRLLGVPGHEIPHDLPSRAAAYRAHLTGTRTLVVLDNAADAHQVRPLLALTPGCLTLVTSRRSLTDLESAHHLTVDVFTAAEASAFLADAVPEVPFSADPEAAARISRLCGYLPLALGLVAGHIQSADGWTLSDHADRLDEHRRDCRLESGVELALAMSYQHLSTEHKRLLRLAALNPGHELDAYAAGALAGVSLSSAGAMLEHLFRDHLLLQSSTGRYSFHDLVRTYAAIRAGDEDPPSQRSEAMGSLFDYYLNAAAIATDVAYPDKPSCLTAVPPTDSPTPDLADVDRANLWLDTELANLLAVAEHAADHGWAAHTWQLSTILHRHLRTRGHQEA